jgi:hypothetical protein
MISFSGSLRIYLLVDGCDMRKGYNGLYECGADAFRSENVVREYERIQRLLRFQRHRSSNCPDRGTEFGWRLTRLGRTLASDKRYINGYVKRA